MNQGHLRRAGLALATLGLVAAGVFGNTRHLPIDPLDVPASASTLAALTDLASTARAGDRLVAVGWRGHIVYSDDQGRHWTQASVPVSADLTAVSFPTPAQGWAVGHAGVILHTNDGGKSWIRQQDGISTAALMKTYYEARARAAPADAKWVQDVALNYGNGPEQPWLDVWFENERHGYVVGCFNLIMETTDGGGSWTPLLDKVDNPDALHLDAIRPAANGLYIASEHGTVFRLDRESGRFDKLQTGYQGTFFGVTGNQQVVLAYGLAGTAYRSADQGRTWTRVETGASNSVTGATSLADGRFVLVTQGGQLLLGPEDASRFQAVPVTQRSPFSAVEAVDRERVLLVGIRGAQIERAPATPR